MARRETPEVNASSLADIAFLLLTFFLVATSMDVEVGIKDSLPSKIMYDEPPPVKERNVLRIVVNPDNQFMVEGTESNVKSISTYVYNHVTNNGLGDCEFCPPDSPKDPTLSENPWNAFVLIQTNKATNYGAYISAKNEIDKGYEMVYTDYINRKYSKNYADLDPNEPQDRAMIEEAKSLFPKKSSEPEPKD